MEAKDEQTRQLLRQVEELGQQVSEQQEKGRLLEVQLATASAQLEAREKALEGVQEELRTSSGQLRSAEDEVTRLSAALQSRESEASALQQQLAEAEQYGRRQRFSCLLAVVLLPQTNRFGTISMQCITCYFIPLVLLMKRVQE